MEHIKPARSNSIWLILGSTMLVLLALTACQVIPPPPLELNNEPAILFFNNEDGCVCSRIIYERADAQIAAWPAESRHGVPLYHIQLEERPDLRSHYRIVRAPTLLLLDADGNEIWRQDEVTTDTQIFDLKMAEEKVLDMQHSTRQHKYR